jgi:hypothetical protein
MTSKEYTFQSEIYISKLSRIVGKSLKKVVKKEEERISKEPKRN